MSTSLPVFKYSFQLTLDSVSDDSDGYFYAVDGLGITYQMDKYSPGGYGNSYAMPVIYETRQLVLRRPLMQEKTSITKWCEDALGTGVFKPTTANILILDSDKTVTNHWAAQQAYPIGLKISSLDLDRSNPIVMEIITLAYATLQRIQ
jgi:phage tail-like protein